MIDNTPPRTLGEQEARLFNSLAAAGHTLFNIEDARAVMDDTDADVPKLLHQLNRKRWIKRLERGKYLIIPPAAGPEAEWAEHEYLIAASLAEPYYLAYATALHYYGYTDRIPDPIIIATTRRKRPVTIDNRTYQFVNLTTHKFFGYDAIELLGESVQIAEREKAIADGFDHPELIGGVIESAKGLWFGRQELDWEKLVTYVLRLRNHVAARRLGYWMDVLDLGADELLCKLEDGGGHSYALLEPSGPRKGSRITRWRIIVNIPKRQLLEWRQH